MSLVAKHQGSKDDTKLSTWSRRDKKALRHSVPNAVKRPVIDYNKLRHLVEISGLKDQDTNRSSADAHREFMQNYSSMFVRPEPLKGLPIHSETRSKKKDSLGGLSKTAGVATKPENERKPDREYPVDKITHDIRDYLPLLHKQRKSEKPEVVKMERIKTLRKNLKKLPFQRTASENEDIYKALKQFPSIAAQCQPHVLKELCVMAHLDVWKEKDVTIFGNTGWHMILKGKAQPITVPHHLMRGHSEFIDIPHPTPEPEHNLDELDVGDCFGTLEQIKDREPNSRVLSVKTTDTNCEFLKISCSDYSRVIEQIKQRVQTEKVNLLQECKTFKLWSRQPLMKVANLLEWVNFPANTVLVSEGYNAPFVGIIKSGECHILRQVDILHTLANGEKEEKSKQVVMGKLPVFESFGEVSCITEDPMTCSIITATAVQIGVVEPEKLAELDDTTRQLLVQSSEAAFAQYTQAEIHDEYVKQELKREWNEFKHNVVIDTINSRGIRPGYGKWSK